MFALEGEPRLSIGAGIRDLERRTADVPIILRTNINNVIEELRPIVERARSNTGNIMSGSNSGHVSLASWLSASHQPAVVALPRDNNNASTSAGMFVIYKICSVSVLNGFSEELPSSFFLFFFSF